MNRPMTDLELLLHELAQMPDPVPKARVTALLSSFAGRRLYLSKRHLVRGAHIRHTAQMLASGMERHEVAKALQARLGIGKTTAYDMIQRALTEYRPVRPPRQAQLEILL